MYPPRRIAAELPQDLDSFLALISTSDIRMKVSIGNKLFTYLEEPSNSIECSNIGMFIDSIVQWLSNSNPKVIQCGIEIITQLITRMRADFKPYISLLLPLAVDRLGDSKEPIKVKAFFLIMSLMEYDIVSPQALFDKISINVFNHKNGHVKEGSMNLLLSTIEEFGVKCITITNIIPMIIKLLSDPNTHVRRKAFETLVDLYKHVGEKLRIDLQKKYSVPQSQMIDLMNKFNEAKSTGGILPNSYVRLSLPNNDETDRSSTLESRSIFNSIKNPHSLTTLHRPNSIQKPSSSSCHTGSIDEDTFIRSFEDVPTLQIFSVRDLDDIMKQLHESIKNNNEQWNNRVDSLKKIRSLILIGATRYEEFFNNLRYLEHSFQISLKDLRSQVVRETCITIAFLAQRLGANFSHFSESIFSYLIDLIPNSAKITASSGLVALRFILEHTHTSRIIPLLANSLVSKSKDIRRACCEFLDQILRMWPTQILERHIAILKESIKKGIADADSGARVFSRKSFWGFCKHFPKQGEILFNQLEPTYHKILLTDSGSSMCLPTPVFEFTRIPSGHSILSNKNISKRSSSAIDFLAAQRAKARNEYAALSRQKVYPIISSLSVAKKIHDNMYQTNGTGRSRGRLSISQPTSQSGSPSSKFTFGQPRSQRGSYGKPISLNASREASPIRSSFSNLQSSNKQPVTSPTNKSIILTQNILVKDQVTECALADAFDSTNNKSPKKVFESLLNYQSDEGKNLNICSDSRKTSSGLLYLNTSQNFLQISSSYSPSLQIEDIILNCENSSWNYRKEGLISLQIYLQQGNILNEKFLRRLTDVFTKMLIESQAKVISLLLDILNDLIITHCQFLEYWLYVLLVKLFIKEGSDIHGSVHSKILKTMETIKQSFPKDIQFISVFKFLTDPTQTPNNKVKVFAMNYLSKLAVATYSGSVLVSSVEGKKDYTTLALTKMIGWTMGNNIKQGPELRRAAQEAIVALYSLNASQITLRLSQLPEEYQDIVCRLIKFRTRRSSVDQLMSRKHQNTSPPTNLASPPLQHDTIDILNSGFMKNSSKYVSTRVLCHYPGEDVSAFYNCETNQMSEHNETNNLNGYKNDLTVTDGIIKILDDLDKGIMQLDHKKSILNHLQELIKDCPSDVHIKHFKKIIKVVIKLLMDNESILREQAILLITCLVQKPEMITCFDNFTELIVMKMLDMCCDPCKPVVKVAEECSFVLSISLQPETMVRIITPLIAATEFPINLMAIKMMTKLIDVYGRSPITLQMKEIMHNLLQSYDHPDSAVRKSVVFCIVSLHKVFNKQEFASYISNLNGPKLKLLYLYIERAQRSTTPTAPKA